MRAVMFCGLTVFAALTSACTADAIQSDEPGDEVQILDELSHHESCPNESLQLDPIADPSVQRAAGESDFYFHPNNGSPGGWIEAHHMCWEGGSNYVICGGWTPVRPYNPSSCGGTVHYWYPQGWHGWAQTVGGCG